MAVGDLLSLSQVIGCVVVECGCWAVVMVCGQPGMFVVVEVTCGRRGSRWWLRWWLWDEEGSRVTVCDACDFWITLALVPKFALSIPYTIL